MNAKTHEVSTGPFSMAMLNYRRVLGLEPLKNGCSKQWGCSRVKQTATLMINRVIADSRVFVLTQTQKKGFAVSTTLSVPFNIPIKSLSLD